MGESLLPPATSLICDERWQAAWREQRVFATPGEDAEGPSRYVFPSCPFTSGNAHMGHVRIYSIGDAFARFRRARGDPVLFSIGFDAFGLPAELEAIQPRHHAGGVGRAVLRELPREFAALGFSFDWERTFVTCEQRASTTGRSGCSCCCSSTA